MRSWLCSKVLDSAECPVEIHGCFPIQIVTGNFTCVGGGKGLLRCHQFNVVGDADIAPVFGLYEFIPRESRCPLCHFECIARSVQICPRRNDLIGDGGLDAALCLKGAALFKIGGLDFCADAAAREKREGYRSLVGVGRNHASPGAALLLPVSCELHYGQTLGGCSLFLKLRSLDFGFCGSLFRTVPQSHLNLCPGSLDRWHAGERYHVDVLVSRQLKEFDEPLLCGLVCRFRIDNLMALGFQFIFGPERVNAGPNTGCLQVLGFGLQSLCKCHSRIGTVQFRGGACDGEVLSDYAVLDGLLHRHLIVPRRRFRLARRLEATHSSEIKNNLAEGRASLNDLVGTDRSHLVASSNALLVEACY